MTSVPPILGSTSPAAAVIASSSLSSPASGAPTTVGAAPTGVLGVQPAPAEVKAPPPPDQPASGWAAVKAENVPICVIAVGSNSAIQSSVAQSLRLSGRSSVSASAADLKSPPWWEKSLDAGDPNSTLVITYTGGDVADALTSLATAASKGVITFRGFLDAGRGSVDSNITPGKFAAAVLGGPR